MPIHGLPHRILSSLRDSEKNWEWLRNLRGEDVEFGTPVDGTDPADKDYVDDAIAASGGGGGSRAYSFTMGGT